MRNATAPGPVLPVPDRGEERGLRLADLLEETSPAARRARVEAATRPVLPALQPLLPDGRLPKGAVIEVAGDTGLLLALAAGPAAAAPTAWTAAIAMPTLGLAAARAYGLPWERLLVADTPGDRWSEVASVLAGACEVILLAAPTHVPPRTLDRLAAHLRRTGTVLLTPGPWPGARLRLEVTGHQWSGLGDGWGRGPAARARTAELRLPDQWGGVSAVVEADDPALTPQGAAPVGVPA
ncbi:hypothetical protein PUR61_08350 [Streptomyces sp. BE20]|uniref:hypothetical protein n=1 Tax=Streptomyces sp. BE20 TaxID=3002525 RepID=UPI002E75D96F|nr:hypothetical protein [Streptomyces sp. BE20]MEE1822205.1 hypothetical protein [Streptomyces sp. BE20]